MVKLRFIILIDFVKTYGYLPSTIGQYPPTRNSIERQSSLVSPEGMVPQERMYLSQFRWLGQPFPLLFLLTLAKKKKKKIKQLEALEGVKSQFMVVLHQVRSIVLPL